MEIRIGEKIKQLRKAKKMTQVELGGDQISKSMLSLIENNLATPSMKSLQYISEKLNKPIAYFIDDNFDINVLKDDTSIKLLLDQANEVMEKSGYLSASELQREMNAIVDSFNPPLRIVHANILNQFSLILTNIFQFEASESFFQRALEIYLYHDMHLDISKAYLNMHINHYAQYDFLKCKQKLDLATEEYLNSVNKDSLHEINLFYHKADLLALTYNDPNQAIRIADQAINLSLNNDMYFLEKLYRLKALLNIERQDYSAFKNNIEKSLNLCKTSNMITKINVFMATAIGENYFGNSTLAMEYIAQSQNHIMELLDFECHQSDDSAFIHRAITKLSEERDSFYQEQLVKQVYTCLIEKAYAYQRLNENNKALNLLQALDFDFFQNKVFLVPNKVYILRKRMTVSNILNLCGEKKEALAIALDIKDHLLKIDSAYDLYKIFEYLSDLYKESNDYENAFTCLKLAHQYLKDVPKYSFER